MKNIRLIPTVLLLIILISSCNNSTNEKEEVQPEIDTISLQIDSLLSELSKSGEFNGNVLVAKEGTKLYEGGFGYANGIKKNTLKLSHKFNIGSIYKEIPAIAIMQLKEREVLNLEDPISNYLPQLPEWSQTVSILNLMQYSSGLPKIDWMSFQEVNDDSLMKSIENIKELEFEPGTDYIYTNYSPFILTKIVESVQKKTFTDYTKDHIFNIVGLTNSDYKNSLPYEDETDMAIPFNSDFEEDQIPFKIKTQVFLFSTTTSDLFKFYKQLHAYKIISKESLNTLGKKANLTLDHMESPLGQVTFRNGEITAHQHHGSSGNYEFLVSMDNAEQTMIIILTNQKNGNLDEITKSIKKLL